MGSVLLLLLLLFCGIPFVFFLLNFLGVHALGSLSLCRVAVEVMNKSLSHISGTPDSLPRWLSVFL
jgi:hypothetical protein